jgi:NAD(P)-dependent dehydrogenase (short-subunit alcohol dehydrogenase family)
MTKLVEGKVALITGAGRGIGREHALLLASHGAKIIVNDLGGDERGEGEDVTAAQSVVDEIRAMGGEAEVNGGNVADMAAAKGMVDQAVETYGDLNIVINNAGILRDRMLFSLTEDDWDSIMGVHLKGTFSTSHYASAYWRSKVKAGEDVHARIINTASPSGLYGNIGQTNYGAAKAGIAAFTIIASMELVRYGITVNALAPAALSRLTAPLMGGDNVSEEAAERMSPRWIAVLAAWLCSEEASGVTGRVFDVRGDQVGVAETWHIGPVGTQTFDPQDLGPVMTDLLSRAVPNSDMDGNPISPPGSN